MSIPNCCSSISFYYISINGITQTFDVSHVLVFRNLIGRLVELIVACPLIVICRGMLVCGGECEVIHSKQRLEMCSF